MDPQGPPWDPQLGGQVGPRWGQVGDMLGRWPQEALKRLPRCIQFRHPFQDRFFIDFGEVRVRFWEGFGAYVGSKIDENSMLMLKTEKRQNWHGTVARAQLLRFREVENRCNIGPRSLQKSMQLRSPFSIHLGSLWEVVLGAFWEPCWAQLGLFWLYVRPKLAQEASPKRC